MMKKTCLSFDISLTEEELSFLKNQAQSRWSEEIAFVKIRGMGLKDYLCQKKDWERVVIGFAGYNMERYRINMFKHLFLFNGGEIWGINIEGKIFRIKRLQALKILWVAWIGEGIKRLVGWFYEMALLWYAAISSPFSRFVCKK